jgi:hypothetical protein
VDGRKLLAIVFAAVLAMFWSGWLTWHGPLPTTSPKADSTLGLSTHNSSALNSATHSSATHGSSGEDDCAGDCRGHQAGYNWAEGHFVQQEQDCDFAGEHSNFAEGCRDYVKRLHGDSKQSYRRPSDDDNSDSDDQ